MDALILLFILFYEWNIRGEKGTEILKNLKHWDNVLKIKK